MLTKDYQYFCFQLMSGSHLLWANYEPRCFPRGSSFQGAAPRRKRTHAPCCLPHPQRCSGHLLPLLLSPRIICLFLEGTEIRGSRGGKTWDTTKLGFPVSQGSFCRPRFQAIPTGTLNRVLTYRALVLDQHDERSFLGFLCMHATRFLFLEGRF